MNYNNHYILVLTAVRRYLSITSDHILQPTIIGSVWPLTVCRSCVHVCFQIFFLVNIVLCVHATDFALK